MKWMLPLGLFLLPVCCLAQLKVQPLDSLVFHFQPVYSISRLQVQKPKSLYLPTTAAALARWQNGPQGHWGLFCNLEWKFEQKTKVPLKFRLGSVDYVDRLEGKYTH